MEGKDKFPLILERLKAAEKILFITGAGVSAESGIPTFRGKDGWWRNFKPEELASPEGFARDPKLVWEWYNHRRQLIRQALPNPAHITIAKFEQHFPAVLVATQNVDGLHQVAGSKNVVEIHGSIWRTRCTKEQIVFAREEIDTEKEVPPKCPRCNAILRPDVVWFGEFLQQDIIHKIEEFIFAPPQIAVTFVIGTSAVFAYINNWARAAQSLGALLVEINPDVTPLSCLANVTLRESAGKILPRLWAEFQPDKKIS